MSNRWINVNDQMPEDGLIVLIFVPSAPNEQVWLGWFDGLYWVWCDGADVNQTVTHWQLRPEPPEAT